MHYHNTTAKSTDLLVRKILGPPRNSRMGGDAAAVAMRRGGGGDID